MEFLSDEMRRDPYPFYEQIRRRDPVLHDPRTDFWMIFDYAGVQRALTDFAAFSSDLADSAGQPTPPWMIFADPPRHSKLRALVSSAMTPRMVAALEPRISQIVRERLDAVLPNGQMDFAQDFAIPLPLMVIAEMIGIPGEEWPRFRKWSDAILKLSQTVHSRAAGAQAGVEYRAVTAEMAEYLPALIRERRSAPQDDLLTRLVTAEVDGERLSDGEIVAFVQLLLVGGNETTTNLLNNALLCFMEDAEELAMLRAHPALLPAAIEEVLRYRSPLQFVFRGTRREIEIEHTISIPRGQRVLAMIGSANRDPAQFADPNRFDITREPNPHLAFGHGIHFCLGAALARLEARVALAAFLERVEAFELTSREPWVPRAALHVLGPERLPIRFARSTR